MGNDLLRVLRSFSLVSAACHTSGGRPMYTNKLSCTLLNYELYQSEDAYCLTLSPN